MKPRDVMLEVSDHAVLRYLERRYGLDVEAVRRHLGGAAISGARLGALAVKTEGVRLILRERPLRGQGLPWVGVVTVVRARPGDFVSPEGGGE